MRQETAIVFLGAPGAGCSSVGAEVARRCGLPFVDLGHSVADALGTSPELALVAVPEDRYRQTEAAVAVDLLKRVGRSGGVVALGSGCLLCAEVRRALEDLRAAGGRLIALTASTRRLASRNGLDAPRSVALGNVHHNFTMMLHQREEQCRELADTVIDTTETSVTQAAEQVRGCDGEEW